MKTMQANNEDHVLPSAIQETIPNEINPIVSAEACADTVEMQPVAAEGDKDIAIENVAQSNAENEYLQGWKFYVLTAGLWIALFLSTLETTIVSTSLVSITNALNGFFIRDWIVTAYLLTYTGFLTIYAKFSDIFGRKTMLILALVIFTLSSVLCGISNNIVELIIFRAFQGIGASGIYSMTMVIAPGLVPIEKYAKYMGIVSTVFIAASVLGPILGGVINTSSSWRWVFLLNVPGGLISLVAISWCLPTSEATSRLAFEDRLQNKFARSALIRVDYFGMFLLLASSVLLVFALEEGGTRYPWNSATVVTTLVIAVLAGILFALWEIYIDNDKTVQEPVFPPSILKDRLLSMMLLTAFFVGFPFVSIVVNIPQRAQAVSGLSPLHAGLALLPLLLISPLATAVSGFLTGKMKVPPFYIVVGSSLVQLLGVGFTCSLPTDTTEIPKSQYGFEVLMGIGFGLGLATLLTFARAVVSEANLAVMMGAVTQVRVLGGTISLAVCATILNNYLASHLESIISPEQVKVVTKSLSTIQDLTPDQQFAVRRAFAAGYNKQNIFMTVLTAFGLITSLFLWERHPRKVL
ncbi:drug resistance transporter EmrB/QacA subfamily [Xylona heveae TC161]|uniref:Drug resistance transporter EmrB/QacA subfamily n=1 Tax=Xylona heveae (strain CBS 132557 / TC161) TaxID=1328760 RepID=A0A165GEK3_XYLHT|nr:drug resistance transporter EmrB/QacA subfamily [Xylona heveae TC161]KZF22095.1 drug resistance transporter EmrB/QacA subfamily [Xylona heveae TC161]